MITDRWFQAEVESCSRRVVGHHHVWQGLADDVSQEVVLLLANKLATDPDLHANAARLPNDFQAWMGTIINHSCGEALRRLIDARAPRAMLDEYETIDDELVHADLRQDMADAIAQLEGREQQVAVLRLKHHTQAMIAEALGLTERQVEYALARAEERLRRLLSGYTAAAD